MPEGGGEQGWASNGQSEEEAYEAAEVFRVPACRYELASAR